MEQGLGIRVENVLHEERTVVNIFVDIFLTFVLVSV